VSIVRGPLDRNWEIQSTGKRSGWVLAGPLNLSYNVRGRACASAGRRKGGIRAAENEDRGHGFAGRAVLGWEERRKEKSSARWEEARFLFWESGGGPVHAPYPMRGSRFLHADLPSAFLLLILNLSLLLLTSYILY
jgi:hypothetical protein